MTSQSPSTDALAWAVGFFESGAQLSPSWGQSIVLRLRRNDAEGLERFKSIVDTGAVLQDEESGVVHFRADNSEVEQIAELLMPHLGAKRRAELEAVFPTLALTPAAEGNER